MSARPGGCFTAQAAPYHRWIVLTAPDPNGDVLIVNLTSLDSSEKDQGCILQPSDYPAYIAKPTTVRFNKAQLVPGDRIQASADLRLNPPVPPHTLRKIQDSALKSPYLKEKFRNLVRAEIRDRA